MKITVAGVGYVGLSLAVLLAQNHEVTAITTTESKAEMLNKFISPIQDDEIERFFKETREGKRKLNLHTTTDKEAAYKGADLVIIATPTNYDDVNKLLVDTYQNIGKMFKDGLPKLEVYEKGINTHDLDVLRMVSGVISKKLSEYQLVQKSK